MTGSARRISIANVDKLVITPVHQQNTRGGTGFPLATIQLPQLVAEHRRPTTQPGGTTSCSSSQAA